MSEAQSLSNVVTNTNTTTTTIKTATATTTTAAAAANVTPPNHYFDHYKFDCSAHYTEEQLHEAMQSIYHSANDTDDGCHHLFGYSNPNHKLSKLQEITATVWLDYQSYLQQQQQQYELDDMKDDTSNGIHHNCHKPPPTLEEFKQQCERMRQVYGPVLNIQTIVQEQAPSMALAAEFKRASPSKGLFQSTSNPMCAKEQAQHYIHAGATIISCLTEQRWFRGSLQDLIDIRCSIASTSINTLQATTNSTLTTTSSSSSSSSRAAVLRKEFVSTKYMIAEAAAAGADSVLLIVAILPKQLLQTLIEYSREWEMEPLVEVNTMEEVQIAIEVGARVIGVNNRNLHTFQLDLRTVERVAMQLTTMKIQYRHDTILREDGITIKNVPTVTLCALSGMSTAHDVDRYRQVGVGMCLIGESLMRSNNPTVTIQNLCLDPVQYQSQHQQVQKQQLQQDPKPSDGVYPSYTMGTQFVKVCGITSAEDALVACQAGANVIGIIFVEQSKRCVSREQAIAVVQAVRTFGERSTRIDFGNFTSEAKSSSLVQSYPTIPQQLQIKAQLLIQATKHCPAVAGVFQNQDTTYIQRMVQECGLDLIQLHGQEGMAATNPNQTGGVPALRVMDIIVDPDTTGATSQYTIQSMIKSITSDPMAILLDTAVKGTNTATTTTTTTTTGTGGGTGLTFDWSIAEKIQALGVPVIVAGGLTPESVLDCVGRIRPFGVDVSSGVEVSPGRKDPDRIRAFVQGVHQTAATTTTTSGAV